MEYDMPGDSIIEKQNGNTIQLLKKKMATHGRRPYA